VTDQNFDSEALVSLLARYRPAEEHESKLKSIALDFVLTNPECFSRTLLVGHVTASSWIVDQSGERILLTHHAKLDRWMQLGGHIEDDDTIQNAALREAAEESGLTHISLVTPEIFDIDIHEIPTCSKAPAHLHYDIRFLLHADFNEPLKISCESKSLRWCCVEEVKQLTAEESVLRMLRKTHTRR
jgi:8-oxo-dGTP pyrophosphatase MutT (NUDIX family)